MVYILALIIVGRSAFAASPELVEVRNTTKQLLSERHCYNCHSPEGAKPLGRAMKVFNLSHSEWFASMTNRQLTEFQRRMLEQLSPEELKEVGGNPKEPRLTPLQENAIKHFVQLEKKERSGPALLNTETPAPTHQTRSQSVLNQSHPAKVRNR